MKKLIGSMIICTILSGCATMAKLDQLVKKPQVNFDSIGLGQVTASNIELKPKFNVTNPNSFPIPVDSIDYTLSFNEQVLVHGASDKIGTLSPNIAKPITLGINITDDVLSNLHDNLIKTNKVAYKVAGNVKVMGLSLPFEHAATLFKPQVNITNFRIEKANLNSIDVVLKLAINNPNQFTIPLDNIRYSVTAKGQDIVKGSLMNQQIEKGTNVITVPLSLASGKLVANVLALLKSPSVPLQIQVTSPMFSLSQQHTLNLSSLL